MVTSKVLVVLAFTALASGQYENRAQTQHDKFMRHYDPRRPRDYSPLQSERLVAAPLQSERPKRLVAAASSNEASVAPTKRFNLRKYQRQQAAASYKVRKVQSLYRKSPEKYVDNMISRTKVQGEKIVRVLTKLQGTQAVARALDALANNGDPCSLIPSNLDATVQGLVDGMEASRAELITLFTIVQDLKTYKGDVVNSIKLAADATSVSAALIPYFRDAIRTNPECQSNLDAAVSTASGLGDVFDVLGNSNEVSPVVQANLRQGAKASRVIGRVASKLQAGQFDSLCSNSPTFSEDVFVGVSELLAGFRELFDILNIKQDPSSIDGLNETVKMLAEAAELMRSLNLSELTEDIAESTSDVSPAIVSAYSGEQCSTSLPDVAKSLDDVVKVVKSFDPKNFA